VRPVAAGPASRAAALALGAALLLGAGAATAALLSAQSPQQPVFTSGVELVAIDVRVVGKDGYPVRGLGPDAFHVTIDGKARRVVSAELVEYAARGLEAQASRQAAPAAAALPRPSFSSNAASDVPESPGRLIYLAVDQGSFKPLAARGAMEAARRFIDRLQPADRIGLVAFPGPGPSVPATRDHAAARAATAEIAGRATPLKAEGTNVNISLSEAIDIRADDALVTQKVLARECAGLSGANRPACELAVRNAALITGHNAEIQAMRSLSGMEAIIRSLARIRERKTLVLVSAGLPMSDRSGRDLQSLPFLTSLGREAASANLNFYVLHVDSDFLDAFAAEQRTISDALDRDMSLMRGGLETIAGSSGGSLVRVVTGADFAFDRVLRETAAEYVLGVEPAEGDRDGKAHRIGVSVNVSGAEVRSRREVLLPVSAAPAAATPEERLARAFQPGRQETALAVRFATCNMAPDAAGLQRVMVSADIGAGAAGGAEIWIALAAMDASGRAKVPDSRRLLLFPRAGSPTGALAFAMPITIAPGRHTLKFVAVDAAGRAGSVDHAFTAGLTRAGSVAMGDLLLVEPAAGSDGPFDVVTDGRFRGASVDAYLDVVSAFPGPWDVAVSFGISESPDGELLAEAEGLVSRTAGSSSRSYTAKLDLGDLAPGDYVVIATVFVDDREAGRQTRTLHIEPPAR